MLTANTDYIPGKNIKEFKGLVQGNSVRTKHFGRDIMANLKNIVGGELKGYTELLAESRRQATDRMIDEAHQLGADAVINIRYNSNSISDRAAEMHCYGTAVTVQDP